MCKIRFDIMTLFPDLVRSVLSESIIGRAQEAGILDIRTHDIRDYSTDKHRRVDDTPYGGGMGMLMAAPPICACHDAIIKQLPENIKTKTVYMSPKGKKLTQSMAKELAGYDNLVILCGHYEGIDERAIEEVVDEEISVGDYVLTGGELPACILVDCVSRLIDGVLSDSECYEEESIASGMLEYPQYTRPVEFRGKRVPEVLTNGDHKAIRRWRFIKALEKTKKSRPDML